MRNNYRLILLVLAGLIVIGGALLFAFREEVLSYVQAQAGINVGLTPVAPAVTASETLDPALLQSPGFLSLVNHVINFNFDNICWRPDTVSQAIAPVSIITAGAVDTAATTTSAASPLNCVEGNSLPFIVKPKP